MCYLVIVEYFNGIYIELTLLQSWNQNEFRNIFQNTCFARLFNI